ncbi:MAG: DUF4190 domain-containing protein [bacterium]|nr:DUF4190 domain-containing protein [bacterium]
MKNKVATFLIVLIYMMAFSSCTIQKRHYLRGYYVDWRKTDREKKDHFLSGRDRDKNPEQRVERRGGRELKMIPDQSQALAVFQQKREQNIERRTSRFKKMAVTHKKPFRFQDLFVQNVPFLYGKTNFLSSLQEENNLALNTSKQAAKNRYYPKKKVHPKAQIALGIDFLSAAIVYLFPFFVVAIGGLSLEIFALFTAALIFLCIVATHFANSARVEIKKRPDLYRGKHLAVTSTITAWVILDIFFGLVLLYAWLVYVWSPAFYI